jgi:hypothetical protein
MEVAPMKVVLTHPVEIGLRTLSDEDRLNVMAWLDHLKDWETDEVVRERSYKLFPDEDAYVLHAGPRHRVFFRLQQDQIEVLDLATKETLLKFKQVAAPAKP